MSILPTPCSDPNCSQTTRRVYCDECRPRHRTSRSSKDVEWSRRYDADWVRFRDAQARKQPLCEVCLALPDHPIRAVDHIHHIIPLEEGGAKLDESNVVSLCQEHHTGSDGMHHRLSESPYSVQRLVEALAEDSARG